LDIVDGKINGVCFFLDCERFYPLFDLPLRFED
jgi:hypothetical protein